MRSRTVMATAYRKKRRSARGAEHADERSGRRLVHQVGFGDLAASERRQEPGAAGFVRAVPAADDDAGIDLDAQDLRAGAQEGARLAVELPSDRLAVVEAIGQDVEIEALDELAQRFAGREAARVRAAVAMATAAVGMVADVRDPVEPEQ